MSTSRLIHASAAYRQHLLAHGTQAERQLDAAYKHVLAHIQARLQTLYQQMEAAHQNGNPLPVSWLYEQRRLDTLKAQIVAAVSHFAHNAATTTVQLQRVSAELGRQAGQALLEAARPAGVSWSFSVLPSRAVEELVGVLQDGSPVADLFASFGEEAASAVGEALVRGVTLGSNPREVARDVARKLQVPRTRALTIARTEMMRPYRSAALQTYQANDDVVEGWVWVADLSARTCPVCLALNGTVHPLSEEFGSHPNCRCTPVPKTKSWAEIVGPDVDLGDIEETTVQVQNGEAWFADQPAAIQRQILGPAKYAAYADGALSLSDLVGTTHSMDWGTTLREKSLSEALGAKQAKQYYKKAS